MIVFSHSHYISSPSQRSLKLRPIHTLHDTSCQYLQYYPGPKSYNGALSITVLRITEIRIVYVEKDTQPRFSKLLDWVVMILIAQSYIDRVAPIWHYFSQ